MTVWMEDTRDPVDPSDDTSMARTVSDLGGVPRSAVDERRLNARIAQSVLTELGLSRSHRTVDDLVDDSLGEKQAELLLPCSTWNRSKWHSTWREPNWRKIDPASLARVRMEYLSAAHNVQRPEATQRFAQPDHPTLGLARFPASA